MEAAARLDETPPPRQHRGVAPALLVLLVVALAAAVASAGWAVREWPSGLRGRARQRVRVTIDARGVHRTLGETDEPTMLARFDEPFGVLLLTPPIASVRARGETLGAWLVFTTPTSTRTLPLTLGVRTLAALPPSLLHHQLRASDGTSWTSPGRGGLRFAPLPPAESEHVLTALAAYAPGSLERLYLSTSRGLLTADAHGLHLPGLSIALERLASRDAYVFLEGSVLYRALAVRQAAAGSSAPGPERVFVAPVSEGQAPGSSVDVIRALHTPPRTPPPEDLRVAIEQLFFAPLAALVEQAPGAPERHDKRESSRCPAASTSPPPSTT